MSIPVLVTGDDVNLPVTLKKNGNTFAIATGSTVQAMLVTTDRTRQLTPVVQVNEAATGSDWANSLVVVAFASADTASMTMQSPAILEIQVDDNGKRTWFVEITIVRGSIP